MGLDIGPKTVELFSEAVRREDRCVERSVGVFEFERFAVGTRNIAEALSAASAVTIVGGGDSAAAIEQMGFSDKITHISTGRRLP